MRWLPVICALLCVRLLQLAHQSDAGGSCLCLVVRVSIQLSRNCLPVPRCCHVGRIICHQEDGPGSLMHLHSHPLCCMLSTPILKHGAHRWQTGIWRSKLLRCCSVSRPTTPSKSPSTSSRSAVITWRMWHVSSCLREWPPASRAYFSMCSLAPAWQANVITHITPLHCCSDL